MEVYIEYVILDNLIINSIILKLTTLILKLHTRRGAILLSALFGTICAIVMPLVNINLGLPVINNLILVTIKCIIGLSMVLLVKKPKNAKLFFTTFLLFLTTTFVFGGLCFGLINALGYDTTFSGVIFNGFEIPISLIILVVWIYAALLYKLIAILKSKSKVSNLYYDVRLNGEKSLLVTGFLDTGNQIEDNGNGVIVINYKMLLKLFPNIDVKSLLTGKLENLKLKNAKFINLHNSSGNDKMLTFTLDKIEIIDNHEKVTVIENQRIGLAKTNFGGRFDCLLSQNIFS